MESQTSDQITQPALQPTSPANIPSARTPPPRTSSFHYTSCGCFYPKLTSTLHQVNRQSKTTSPEKSCLSLQGFALAPRANFRPALSLQQPILNSKIQQITQWEFTSNISKAKSTMKGFAAALKIPKLLKDKIAKFSKEIEAS
ncbi:hypothetical protein PCASD_15923 [Puccinia coronata f. sp. avenae]|uniref:Uncharacterized protein n=1 Tax=Puccinia coronata f. sp. avenae TaxID=200324 RepID=A0A2N5UEV5_9BASI|nr:hypothetical protein PCASD_15923 [Puccinia coronata f. sp. avenae]